MESQPQPRPKESKLVQLRLRPTTIQKVEELQEILDSPNRTTAVASAIGIAHAVVRAAAEKKAIYAEDSTGARERLIISELGG